MTVAKEHTGKGAQSLYTHGGAYNQTDFQIEQKLLQDVSTAFIGQVNACGGQGASAGSTTLSATQMTAQTDYNGAALPQCSIPKLPYVRNQAGIAAIVIEPTAGDLGVFVSCKQDISGIKQGASVQPPKSYRTFSASDSVYIGAVHTKAPLVYIELKQDKTISVKAPAGYTLETDSDVSVKAGGNITLQAGGNVSISASAVSITAPTTVNGTLTQSGGGAASFSGGVTASGDVVGKGKSLASHTHTGNQGVPTSAPN